MAIRKGTFDDNGMKGKPEDLAHATTYGDNGKLNDKNGTTDPGEAGKPLSEVLDDHLGSQGFEDPDGDGVYTNPDNPEKNEWRDVACYTYDPTCCEGCDD